MVPKFDEVLAHKKLFLALWFATAFIILAIEYLTGPDIRFSLVFIIPVSLATRINGLFWGLFFSIMMPIFQFLFIFLHSADLDPWDRAINTTIRITALALFAFLIDRITQQARVIRVLKGFLPVCSFCRKVRNEKGEWEEMEHYIVRHSEAEFSHTFCPECGKKHYGEYAADDDESDSSGSSEKDHSARS